MAHSMCPNCHTTLVKRGDDQFLAFDDTWRGGQRVAATSIREEVMAWVRTYTDKQGKVRTARVQDILQRQEQFYRERDEHWPSSTGVEA